MLGGMAGSPLLQALFHSLEQRGFQDSGHPVVTRARGPLEPRAVGCPQLGFLEAVPVMKILMQAQGAE